VISELDIYRAANPFIRQHGAGAASETTRLAGRMLDRGDSDGWQVWARIRLASRLEAAQAVIWCKRKRRSSSQQCSGYGKPQQREVTQFSTSSDQGHAEQQQPN